MIEPSTNKELCLNMKEIPEHITYLFFISSDKLKELCLLLFYCVFLSTGYVHFILEEGSHCVLWFHEKQPWLTSNQIWPCACVTCTHAFML